MPASISMNLPASVDYNHLPAFINCLHNARMWGSPLQPGQPYGGSFDSVENPLQPATLLFDGFPYPSGVYKLSWVGSLVPTAIGGGVIASVASTGSNTANVTVDLTRGGLFDLLITPGAGGFSNLKLLCPGYTSDAAVFRAEFVALFKGFSHLRFMDPENVISNPIVNWSDRRTTAELIASADYIPGKAGIPEGWPWEYCIALANATNTHPWLNIPYKASDDYIRQLCALVGSSLNPGLVPLFAWSNENWNTAQGAQYNDLVSIARANPVAGSAAVDSDFTKMTKYSGLRAAQVAAVVKTALPTSRRAFEGWAANSWYAQTALDFAKSQGLDPAALFTDVSIAPYFADPATDVSTIEAPGLTLDSMFAQITHDIATVIPGWITSHLAVAKGYGLTLSGYEGGWGNGTVNNDAVKWAAQTDPRMGTTTSQLAEVWKANGGETLCFYALTAPMIQSKGNYWAHLGTAKWTGLQATMAAWSESSPTPAPTPSPTPITPTPTPSPVPLPPTPTDTLSADATAIVAAIAAQTALLKAALRMP